MCYPAGEDDPDRHRLKGSVLGALLPNYAAAGIRTLVVSGVLDPALAGWTSEQLVGAEVTFCRLVVGKEELRRRLDQRGGGESWDAVRRADRELEPPDRSGPPWSPTGSTRARSRPRSAWVSTCPWICPSTCPPTCPAPPPAMSPLSPTGARLRSAGAAQFRGTVLWLCGTTGVGTSTVGWHAFTALLRAGHSAAFLDLRQLAFVGGATKTCHRLASANVAAAWDCFGAAGATHLVLCGAVDTRGGRPAVPRRATGDSDDGAPAVGSPGGSDSAASGREDEVRVSASRATTSSAGRTRCWTASPPRPGAGRSGWTRTRSPTPSSTRAA